MSVNRDLYSFTCKNKFEFCIASSYCHFTGQLKNEKLSRLFLKNLFLVYCETATIIKLNYVKIQELLR